MINREIIERLQGEIKDLLMLSNMCNCKAMDLPADQQNILNDDYMSILSEQRAYREVAESLAIFLAYAEDPEGYVDDLKGTYKIFIQDELSMMKIEPESFDLNDDDEDEEDFLEC